MSSIASHLPLNISEIEIEALIGSKGPPIGKGILSDRRHHSYDRVNDRYMTTRRLADTAGTV